jgi:hypothetical protein
MSTVSGSVVSTRRFTVGDDRLRVSHLAIARTGVTMEAEEEFRCRRCGDLIGVYEPLVVCSKDGAHTTSRAAEPGLEATGATHYHRACYTGEVGEE